MTLESVWAQLEQDLSWRHEEIRLLSNTLGALRKESQRDQLRRAQLVMLYAHVEGFCKVALLVYLKAINSAPISRSQVCDELVASSLDDLFHALKFGDKKGRVFESPLPAEEKMQLIARRRDFVREFEKILAQPLAVPESIVNTEDNLSSLVLRKCLFRLGLAPDLLAEHEAQFDELVNRRNSIAHGADDAIVRAVDYDRLQKSVFGAMDILALTITDAIERQLYLRAAPLIIGDEALTRGEMR